MVWTYGTCWKLKKVNGLLWLMAWDGLPSSWPEFLSPHPTPFFTQVLDVFLLLWPCFKECGLSIIELFCSVKPSCFNMIMSVKTIGHFFLKKIFEDVISGYNAMYVNNKLFPKKSMATCYNISFSQFWNGLLSNLLSVNIAQYFVS